MKSRKVYALALTAILMWSTAGTAFKLSLKGLSFTQLLFISSHTAWIVLLLFVILKGKFREVYNKPTKSLLKSAIGGFLNPFLYYIILLKAYTLLPAQIAQPLNYTWPIMLVLLSIPFLGQKLKWTDGLAIVICFSGVLVISAQGSNPFKTRMEEPLGVLLAVGSSLIWASFWIYNLKDKRDELIKICLNFFFGAIFTTIFLLFTDGVPKINISWLPASYVGLTEMAIAFVCWLTALENTANNSRISNLVFISPFLALFFINLILKESIYATTPIGLVLIILGILFQQLMARSSKVNE